MKKDLGVIQAIYPMPVLMVAAYDENQKVNVMNVAWGQICDYDKLILFIGEGKKTLKNILTSKAFTVALADEKHMDVADFFGMSSGNKIEDKFEQISAIIETLEQPATSLTESLKLYTQGVKILKECNDELDKVEKQLIILDGEEENV